MERQACHLEGGPLVGKAEGVKATHSAQGRGTGTWRNNRIVDCVEFFGHVASVSRTCTSPRTSSGDPRAPGKIRPPPPPQPDKCTSHNQFARFWMYGLQTINPSGRRATSFDSEPKDKS
eukprot:5601037-Pyramimonas_sp.AAC.2